MYVLPAVLSLQPPISEFRVSIWRIEDVRRSGIADKSWCSTDLVVVVEIVRLSIDGFTSKARNTYRVRQNKTAQAQWKCFASLRKPDAKKVRSRRRECAQEGEVTGVIVLIVFVDSMQMTTKPPS